MSEITLADLKAQHVELGERIAAFEANLSRILNIDSASIELRSGEHYAGAILNDDGSVDHHLVLMAATTSERLSWDDAIAWAVSAGGDLPTRREQALLFANLKSQLKGDWYWSNQAHESSSSYAWGQFFGGGCQCGNHKSYEGLARAVRRV